MDRGPETGPDELRRRAIASLETESRTIGGHGPGGRVLKLEGVVAAMTPAAPERSLFNSVAYTEPDALTAALDRIEPAYGDAGLRAWTVWVPDRDREIAAALERRGHKLDGAPRAMSLWLEDLVPPPPSPEGIEICPGGWPEAGRINDAAYGHERPSFAAAFEAVDDPDSGRVDWHLARPTGGGEPVACVATVPAPDDDVLVTCVATLPSHQGRGIASSLMHGALARAGEAGARSASLRASAAGAPVYERLGFADHGYVELWEKRG